VQHLHAAQPTRLPLLRRLWHRKTATASTHHHHHHHHHHYYYHRINATEPKETLSASRTVNRQENWSPTVHRRGKDAFDDARQRDATPARRSCSAARRLGARRLDLLWLWCLYGAPVVDVYRVWRDEGELLTGYFAARCFLCKLVFFFFLVVVAQRVVR